MVGAENQADRVRYVVAFTRDPEALDNELTGGWKVMEVSLSPIDWDQADNDIDGQTRWFDTMSWPSRT